MSPDKLVFAVLSPSKFGGAVNMYVWLVLSTAYGMVALGLVGSRVFKAPIRTAILSTCGICPTYFHKLCAFDFHTNETYIFDNVCIMDLYNCIHGTEFVKLNYENCLYFGNFAYVHGFKYEDYDYEEDHFSITHSKKNPDFA